MINKEKDRTMDKKQMPQIIMKRKAPVLFVVFFLFAVIAFALLLSNRQGKEQQVTSMKEQEQLADMADYLNEIDNTVTENAERLAEASLVQMETERILTESSESFAKLEENLSCVENLLNGQIDKQAEQNSKILQSITALTETQQMIRSQIAAVNTSISSVLSDLKVTDEKNFTATFEQLKDLQGTLTETEKKVRNYYRNLENLITLLQEENSEEHKEILDNLLDAKQAISVSLNNCFSDIKMQMKEEITALMEKMICLHEEIVDAEDAIVALLKLMEEGNAERQEEIREAFASIGLSLEQIREDYSNAHMEINNLIQKLEDTENANHKETLSVLTVMESNMEENSIENLTHITKSLQDMEENFSETINNMKGEITQNFSSLNSELTRNMSEYNSSMMERFSQLDNSLTNNEQNFSASISNMKDEMTQNFSSFNKELIKNISEYNSSLTDMFQQLGTNIENQYRHLSNTVNNYDTNQQECLDNLMSILEQKLQQVFQYVSSGKKKLASALLTKGVSIREDATFAEIYQAILDIPQELVIGVQEIPGNITYDYHYHVNYSGGISHSGNENISGGCYTMPIYHMHTGDSRNGGGCYTVPDIHTHTTECYIVTTRERKVTERWFTGEGTGHECCDDAHGQNWARYSYEDNVYVNGELVSSVQGEGDLGYCCGLCLDKKASAKASKTTVQDIICGYTEGLQGYQTGCGKNNQTVEEYIPGCGFSDGQIIGASITYN